MVLDVGRVVGQVSPDVPRVEPEVPEVPSRWTGRVGDVHGVHPVIQASVGTVVWTLDPYLGPVVSCGLVTGSRRGGGSDGRRVEQGSGEGTGMDISRVTGA